MDEKILNKPGLMTGLIVGALVTAATLAVIFLANAVASLPLIPLDIIDWAARNMPGELITFGIDTMVAIIGALNLGPTSEVAKLGEQMLGVFTLFLAGVIASGVLFLVLKRFNERRMVYIGGIAAGLAIGLPMLFINANVPNFEQSNPLVNAIWIVAVFVAWGLAVAWIYNDLTALKPVDEAAAGAEAQQIDRRQFLVRVGGATAVLTVAGAGLSVLFNRTSDSTSQTVASASNPDPAPTPTTPPSNIADSNLEPAPGTRPEYTPLEDHYRIDISTRPPNIDSETWVLAVSGLVNNPMNLTLDDLRAYESQDQMVTLSCISNPIAGDLISTTRWTGVSMQKILETLEPSETATHLLIRSADGFDEVVDLELIRSDERIMLAYEWDGRPLLQKHGFPLRIWIPDHFGMKQPKWITEFEFIDEWQEGYWVRRGWSATALVKTTSVIDTVSVNAIYEEDGTQYVPIGGIAYSGDRGISRVEVQIDDNDWVEADLRAPLSETTWVVWRYDWPFEAGSHTFSVRTYEADGTMQVVQTARSRPDGASGIHTVRDTV